MKTASIVLIVGLLTLVNISVGAPEAAEVPLKPEKGQISIGLPTSSSDLLVWYLAVDSGLYEKEGLKVELVTFKGGAELIKAVIAKSIDVGVSGLDSRRHRKILYSVLH